ncbi:MAG: hypothetical protein JO280_16040 [Mycobacteriaceae bacterium]|nr:hypothetical protein [Mycobacteriaceae bacterium]
MARLRPPSMAKLAGLAAVLALFCTFAFVHDIIKKSWTTSSLPFAGAQPSPGATATQASSPAGPYPADDRGFLNSSARCEGSLTAVAIARTDASLVTICADQQGGYAYHGVRLSDGAALQVAVDAAGNREFVARNDGVTYSLTTQQLVITAADTVLRREPVIQYREPHSFPAETPPGQGSTASPPSTPRPGG